MKKKNIKIFASSILVWITAALNAGTFPETPTKTSDWWQIAERAPTPYAFNGEEFNWVAGDACDFTIYRTENGKWHLVSCIRLAHEATTFAEIERFFYHWETDDLRNPRWKRKGIFMLDVNGYRTTMQAPHCFWMDGKMYMYFNAQFPTLPWGTFPYGAYSLVSEDGGNSFTYLQPAPPSTNTLRIHEMSRDVMVLDDREGVSGKIISMFLNNSSAQCPAGAGKSAYFGARTANNVAGPYSTDCPINIASGHEINPESPFMVRRGADNYYLWSQSNIMHSTGPLDFSNSAVLPMAGASGRYAPEVIEWNGEYFYAGYSSGIYLSQMEWISDKDHNVYLSSLSAEEGILAPAFDKYQDEYTLVVENSVTSLNLRADLESSKSTLTITGNENFPEGRNDVKITVAAENGLDKRTYRVRVYRLAPGEKVYDLTVDGQLYGRFPAGALVKVLSDKIKRDIFKNWTGDVEIIRCQPDYIDCPGITIEMPGRNAALGTSYLNTYKVTLKVVDDDGNPKSVRIVLRYQGVVPSSTTGLATFNNVPEGRHVWMHDGAGNLKNIRAGVIDVTSDIAEQVIVFSASQVDNSHLPTSTVTIKAVNENSEPVADVVVIFNKEQIKTDTEGKAVFTDVPNADHTLTCGKRGFVSYTRNVGIDGDRTITAVIKTFEPTDMLFYKANVINGSGSGQYSPGSAFDVQAYPKRGMMFDGWTGDTQALDDPESASTGMTVVNSHLTVTATYKEDPSQKRELTVVGGTGSGTYIIDDVVTIEALAEREGDEVFDRWTGDIGNVADPEAASTIITIKDNATVTATYKKRIYSITVENGTADKENASMDEIITLYPLAGENLNGWEIVEGGIVIDENNQFIMPANTVRIKGLYHISIENTPLDPVSVYPNPAENKLFVKGIGSAATYSIVSESGMLMQTGIYLPGQPIRSNTLKPGLYFLKINGYSIPIILK